MSLIPRRGPGRHGQLGGVAVHPGWTLSPTSVGDSSDTAVATPVDAPVVTVPTQPTSRWTSSPALPPATPAPAAGPVPVALVPAPVAFVPAPVAVPNLGWAREWEEVASTPTTPTAPLALHTAPVAPPAALAAAVPAPAAWTAAPADFEVRAHPAPLAILAEPLPSPTVAVSALDAPLPAIISADTPLALEAARARQVPPPPATPPAPPVADRTVLPTLPPPPSMPPPPRTVQVPAAAQRLLDRAVRTAPMAPARRRSTVRLGFTDASVIDLRPEDPIAKALHTVAAALIGRDRD